MTTDAVPSNTAPNTAGNSGSGVGGNSGAGGGHGESGGGKEEKRRCATCGLFHRPQVACWEVCTWCGERHHYRAPCTRVQDPQRLLVEENRALHEQNRALEQENARLRSQLDMQITITNLQQQQLQQQTLGSMYSSPYSFSQPAMQPQAFNSLSMQPPAWEQPRASGSFSGFGRSKQTAPTWSGLSQGSGTFVGGKGREGDGAEKKEAEKPKKIAESSKKKIGGLRKKQADVKKQPGEKNELTSTLADNCDQAASTEGKKQSRSSRQREKRRQQKAKEAEGKRIEGVSGHTEAMEVDKEAQAPTSAGPDEGGEENNREAEESNLAFRERSPEGQVPSVAPAVAPQPQPQPSQKASEPAGSSAPGVGDESGEASGPS